MRTKWRNFGLGGGIVSVIIGMMVLSFASVPLYRLFCSATGYGGTPTIGLEQAPGHSADTVRVAFNASVNRNLEWSVGADQREQAVTLGVEQVAFFHASNRSDTVTSGMALYNVTPEKVGKYFHKVACFCLTKQVLAASKSMEFPVSYWIDPAMRSDPNTRDVSVITLSYEFFRAANDVADAGGIKRDGL